MIVPYQEVMEHVRATDSFTLQNIHKSIEESVRTEIGRKFASTTYYNRRYNGTGNTRLLLDYYPVSAIERISLSTANAIKIKNTSTDAGNAYAEVIYTDYAPISLKLVVPGGDDESSSTYTFSDYATLETLIAAATGSNGWELAIYDSDFNSYKSTNLLERKYQFAGSWNGVERSAYTYLLMAGQPIDDTSFFVEDEEAGIIYYAGGFPEGIGNVIITYTTGYAAADMPSDIKLAILVWIQAMYTQHKEDSFGLKQYGVADLSATFEEIPAYTRRVLQKYGADL